MVSAFIAQLQIEFVEEGWIDTDRPPGHVSWAEAVSLWRMCDRILARVRSSMSAGTSSMSVALFSKKMVSRSDGLIAISSSALQIFLTEHM